MSVRTSEKAETGSGYKAVTAAAVLVLVVVAVGYLAWPRSNPMAREARNDLEEGRYDHASKVLTEWLKVNPTSAEAIYLNGRVLTAKGDLSEAAASLKKLQDLGHDRSEIQLLHALIAVKAGRHTEALPVLKQVYISAKKPDPQLSEALARVYLETFDLTSAAAVLARWAADFPDDPKPHLWRTEIHSRDASDSGVLEQDYREVLKRDPNSARARLGLADELRKAHRNADASAEYEAYLKLEPDDASAHLGAGRNAMESGDESAATRHLERAIKLDPKNAEPHIVLANSAFRRGEWAAALASIDRAISIDPNDLTSRNLRGLALTRLDRVEEAKAEQAAAATIRKDLTRLNEVRSKLIKSPHDRESQVEIARWMFQHDHDEEGVRWAKKILAEHSDDSEAAQLLADHYQRHGETGLANFYKMMSRGSASTKPPGSPK